MSGIILAQPQDRRRDRLASLVLLRRLAGFSRWSVVSKTAVMLVAVSVTLCSQHRLVAWVLLMPALVGTALDLLAVHVTQGTPRGRLLRGYEAHLVEVEGDQRLNLPAYVECVGAVAMVAAAAWAVTDLPNGVRLVYVAVATAYLGTVSSSIFDDSAWYNPEVRAPHWQEIDRILCGVQACVVVLAITWTAPWGPAMRIGLIAIAVSGLLVPLRAGQTQLLVADLGPLVEAERQRGTRLVIEEASRELLPVLIEMRQVCAELGPEAANVARLAESALAGIGDIPNQVAHSARQLDGQPLQVVADRLISLGESAGRDLTVAIPATLDLGDVDRSLASQTMRDLAGNAISAQATRIHVEVRRAGPRLMIIVADDGRPIPAAAWRAPGSSTAALAARLDERQGSLTFEHGNLNKVVMATWVSLPAPGASEKDKA